MIHLKPKIHIAAACALLLMAIAASSAIAAVSSAKLHSSKHHPKHTSLAGTWSGQYNGAFSGTFTLHWTKSGSHLSGSITLSNPSGKYGINGSVHGSAIQFGAVGAGATYTGKVSGKSMSGNYPDPFTSGLGSTCEVTCAATLGPCYAKTLDRKDISEGHDGVRENGSRPLPHVDR